jgi:hypothetical protein
MPVSWRLGKAAGLKGIFSFSGLGGKNWEQKKKEHFFWFFFGGRKKTEELRQKIALPQPNCSTVN